MKKASLIDLIKFEFEDIQDTDCFCNACRIVYTNKLDNPTYTPTKTRKKKRPQCYLSRFRLCNDSSLSESSMPDLDDLFTTFCIPPHFRENVPVESTIDLCKIHYNVLYRSRTLSFCSSCNSEIPQYRRRYFCSAYNDVDLNSFNLHLNNLIGDVQLNDESILCPTCYFCAYNFKISQNKTLAGVMNNLENVDYSNMLNEEILHKKGLVEASLFVLNLFQKDEAVLAIDVYECYQDKLNIMSKVFMGGQYSAIQAKKMKWLLSGLSGFFGQLLQVEKSVATNHSHLLVYKYCNLRKALHESLFQLRVSKRKLSREQEDVSSASNSSQPMNIDLLCTAKEMNHRLKEQAKSNQEYYKQNPLAVDSIDFLDIMNEHTDPTLWNFLNVLTMNSAEEVKLCQGFSKVEHVVLDCNNDYAKERLNRRVILMFILQFVMNDHYNYPFHVIHAGIIKQLTNSSKLVEMFNQSGWCVGLKTYDRFLGEILATKSDIPKALLLKTPTFVTVDNVDSESPFQEVRVSRQDQGRGWHGTSVMAQQTLPISEELHPFECLEDQSNLYTIKTYGCGRCIYRCLAIVGCSELVQCERNVVGFPQDKRLWQLETELADCARTSLVCFMEANLQVFEDLPVLARNLYLERHNGEFDESFDTRIKRNRNVSTFAGSLEISTLAFLLKTQIQVYQMSPCNLFKQIGVYPKKYFNCGVPIRLLYTHDTVNVSGHFDLLLSNEQTEFCDWLDVDVGNADTSKFFEEWAFSNNILDDNSSHVTLMYSLCGDNSYGFHDDDNDDDDDDDDADARSRSMNVDSSDEIQSHPTKRRKPYRQLFSFRTDKTTYIPNKTDFVQPLYMTFLQHQLNIDVFKPSTVEDLQSGLLSHKVLIYVLERFAKIHYKMDVLLPSLKCKFAMEQSPTCEKSKCAYLSILDEKADSVATVKIVLHDLFERFQISKQLNHLFVVGDMKTFEYIMKVKTELGSAMDWVIPYPGDWHILKNFQEVIMKIYWDAGLKDLAKISHFGMSLSKLQSCGNFKKVHRFLMQAYEAIYMLQLKIFLAQRNQSTSVCPFSNDDILRKLQHVLKRLNECKIPNIGTFINDQKELEDSLFPFFRNEFDTFRSESSKMYKTFAFWDRFLNIDMFSYIEFYIALRSRNWVGRLAALKKMCVLFHAFDRYNYSRWLSVHLSQMFGLPSYIVKHLENGAFASSILGVSYSCVGMDEWHEMGINKHVKSVIVRNTPKDIKSTVHTLSYVAGMISNYDKKVSHKYKRESVYTQRDFSPSVIRAEHENIRAYFEKMVESNIFSSNSERLFHAFSGAEATPVVENNLSSYHELGQSSFEAFVECRILKQTSTHVVVRKHRLQTFTLRKVSKRKISNLEKERKLITKCFKRTIDVLSQGGSLESHVLQCIETPRAICTEFNTPVTGKKSNTYGILHTRYEKKLPVIIDKLPFPQNDWCVILEGMNLIYKEPRGVKTFHAFVLKILNEWILPYYRSGYREVRLLFDQSGTQGLSPKVIEQKRRDVNDAHDDEDLILTGQIEDDTLLPSLKCKKAWSQFLKIRKNKHLLCVYAFDTLLKLIKPKLIGSNKVFIVSGGFHRALDITEPVTIFVDASEQSPYTFQTNHEESDTQIWLHVFDTRCSNVLIRSVDRDIAMVGLPLMPKFQNKSVYIQFDASKSGKYLFMNNLERNIIDDADLSGIAEELRCFIVQSLYICSGCDFVSFFKEKGKSTVFKSLYQYANFINNGNSTLAHTALTDVNGLHAFFRLIGCVFFTANTVSLNDFDTPVELFNTFSRELDASTRHIMFLDRIRKASWQGTFEHELLPSNEALKYHWFRSCWVSSVWCQSLDACFDFPSLLRHGWEIDKDGSIAVTWDSAENMQKVVDKVAFLTRGCGCKSLKNQCQTKRCKCYRDGKKCGPGCSCKHCENCSTSVTLSTDSNSDITANAHNPVNSVQSELDRQSDYSSDSEDSVQTDSNNSDSDSDTPLQNLLASVRSCDNPTSNADADSSDEEA